MATGASIVPIGAEVPADHGAVAPVIPRLDLPEVLDGVVEASAQFGDKVVVGGSFTQIERTDGSVLNRSFLFAYDINTGTLIEDFDPQFDKEVQAIESADDGSGVVIAGKFNTVDGLTRRKIVKLDADGEVIAGFTANANSKVTTLDDDGVRIYVGGSFTAINGEPRSRLAALDLTTGAVDSFRNDVTVDVGSNTGAVKSVDVSPDNSTLLVAHASALVDGQDRFGLAQIDLATDTVTPWRTDWYKIAVTRCSGDTLKLRDASYSPDGSYFVVVEKGGFRCDKAIAFPTADGPGLEENLWVLQGFDSIYSVAISDFAVYIGGHFCFVNPLGPIPTARAANYFHPPKPAPCASGGNEDTNGITARYQVAALDPVDGSVLDWNPGANVQEAVFDIEIVDRGVLLGMDRDRVNGYGTGRHAFLDFGGLTPPPEPPEPPTPPAPDTCDSTVVAGGVQLDWSVTDQSVNRFHVRRDGSWVTSVERPTMTYLDTAAGPGSSHVIRYRVDGTIVNITCD